MAADTPAARELKSLVTRWFDEVWNAKREATIDELAAPDCIVHGLGEGGAEPLAGSAAFKRFWRQFLSALPDIRVTIQDVIAEGDRAAFRFVAEGTHTGDGLGVKPTGRRVRVTAMGFIRARDGQIVEGWNEFDAAGLMRQITDTEPPAAAKPH
jgi:steroid delta-isomerase-like uncharacterized protein